MLAAGGKRGKGKRVCASEALRLAGDCGVRFPSKSRSVVIEIIAARAKGKHPFVNRSITVGSALARILGQYADFNTDVLLTVLRKLSMHWQRCTHCLMKKTCGPVCGSRDVGIQRQLLL